MNYFRIAFLLCVATVPALAVSALLTLKPHSIPSFVKLKLKFSASLIKAGCTRLPLKLGLSTLNSTKLSIVSQRLLNKV